MFVSDVEKMTSPIILRELPMIINANEYNGDQWKELVLRFVNNK